MKNILKKQWSDFLANDFVLFRLINAVTTDNHCVYYLVGAKARDLLFEYFGCGRLQRATLDTDIAICCKNWQEFEKIKHAFLDSGNFTRDQKIMHRIHSENYGMIDIIPFGEIEGEGAKITWPPEYDIEFSLAGFEDAYGCALEIEIEDFTVRVTSPAGFVLLKLFAWTNRKTQKDASDFLSIISNYLDLGNQDRLFEEHPDLVNQDFDYILSGCRLLGRDLNQFSLNTKDRLSLFFNESSLMDQFTIAISNVNRNYEEVLNMLDMIRCGFIDRVVN